MNASPIEEGGKVANTLIDALKAQPLTLALVVFNVIFLTVVYFGMLDQRKSIEAYQTKMFDQQAKTMEMLYNCTPHSRWPGQGGEP